MKFDDDIKPVGQKQMEEFLKNKTKQTLIQRYKATAYVFSEFILNAEANEVKNLTETKEYMNLCYAVNKLAEYGIKVSDLKLKMEEE